MVDESRDDAESWLIARFTEAEAKLRRWDTDVVADAEVGSELRQCSSAFEREVRAVIGRWLLSDDDDKVMRALGIVDVIGASEHIGALNRLHLLMKSRQSPLAANKRDREYYMDVLPRVILSLMKKRGDNWWRLSTAWVRLRLLPAMEESLDQSGKR